MKNFFSVSKSFVLSFSVFSLVVSLAVYAWILSQDNVYLVVPDLPESRPSAEIQAPDPEADEHAWEVRSPAPVQELPLQFEEEPSRHERAEPVTTPKLEEREECDDNNSCTFDFLDPVMGCLNLLTDLNSPETPGDCYLSNIDQDTYHDNRSDLDMDCPLQFKDDPTKCDGYCDSQEDYEMVVSGPAPHWYDGQTCKGVDNCPWVYNPDQLDSDSDGLGDACDPYNGK